MKGRLIHLIVLVLLLSSMAIALTPDERAYFDSQNQKTVAQINSKIDSQVTRIEKNLKTEGENIKSELKNELGNEVKSSLKIVAVGLGGIVVMTLGLFRVVDLRFSTVKNVKKYEQELKKKKEEYERLIAEMKQEQQQMKQAYQQPQYQQQPQMQQQAPQYQPPTPSSEMKLKTFLAKHWKKFLIGALVFGFLASTGLYLSTIFL